MADALPPRTRRTVDRFFQCTGCAQVYWKGSQDERMQAFVAALLAD